MAKQKLYLDTNLIHDLFTKQAHAMKTGQPFHTPRKFAYLIEQLTDCEYMISFLTKAEIAREMVSAHSMKPELVEQAWNGFLAALRPAYISTFTFDDSLVRLILSSPMKLRTMFNFLHLFIAMHEGAYFVSGDKQIIAKIRELGIYKKTLTYIELRKTTFP